MNNRPELLASCWTSAGDARPMRLDERSPVPIETRIEAVAAAGFSSMGLTHADVVEVRDTVGLAGVAELARAANVRIAELEMVMDWQEFEDSHRRRAADQVRDDLIAAATILGASHIKAGCDYQDREWEFAHLVREFSLLCDKAAQADLTIALEPQAFCHIKTPDDGMRLIDAAGSTNAGLCVDIWHLERIGYPLATLASLDPARIICVEINDADAVVRGSLIEDTVANRKLPGMGSFDLPAFIKAIAATGYEGPWGVEMLSDEFRRQPIGPALTDAYAAAAEVLHGAL